MVDDPEPLLFRQLMGIRPSNMTANAWLVSAGVNRSFFTDLKKRGRARSDVIEKLVRAAGMSPEQFYALTPPPTAPEAREQERAAADLPFRRLDEKRDVPLLGTALGADFEVRDNGEVAFAEATEVDMGEVVDRLRRPPVLAGRTEVYALNVVGSSMSPRFDPGDPLYVDPKATPRIGDDVVVHLITRDSDGEGRVSTVLIKRLAKLTARLVELEQFNPSVTFVLERTEVAHVHRVIPWRELANF